MAASEQTPRGGLPTAASHPPPLPNKEPHVAGEVGAAKPWPLLSSIPLTVLPGVEGARPRESLQLCLWKLWWGSWWPRPTQQTAL